jgi:hypothetical protein
VEAALGLWHATADKNNFLVASFDQELRQLVFETPVTFTRADAAADGMYALAEHNYMALQITGDHVVPYIKPFDRAGPILTATVKEHITWKGLGRPNAPGLGRRILLVTNVADGLQGGMSLSDALRAHQLPSIEQLIPSYDTRITDDSPFTDVIANKTKERAFLECQGFWLGDGTLKVASKRRPALPRPALAPLRGAGQPHEPPPPAAQDWRHVPTGSWQGRARRGEARPARGSRRGSGEVPRGTDHPRRPVQAGRVRRGRVHARDAERLRRCAQPACRPAQELPADRGGGCAGA